MIDEASAADATGFDEATLQGLLEDVGIEQLPLVLGLFVDELGRRAAELLAARDAGAVESLRRAAHGVKGSASTFGARQVAAAARRLEDDCRAARPAAELVDACNALLTEMNRAADWVRQRLARTEEMK